MKEILIIHSGEGGATTVERFMGHDLRLRRIGCGGDAERARALITAATESATLPTSWMTPSAATLLSSDTPKAK